jgi:5'-nucleotidase/UDP-sugar diphosphatase
VPAALEVAPAPKSYGKDRLPAPVAQYAADRDFLDGWDPAADPAALTVADGARLLAAARYPLITILSTTDFHGAFQSRDRDRDSDRPLGSSAILAAYLARERAANPRGTLLFDGGDSFQGTMMSNLSYGRPVIAQMNRLGYDAMAVGNHDFDWTVDTLVARGRQARFPLLAANLFVKRGGQRPSWVKSYAIFERHGVKIAVLGFSTVETPTVTLPSNVADLEFREPGPIAREWLPKLRAEGADAVVLLSHLPGSQDSSGTSFRGELAEFGRAVEGEDALLGGHSHNLVSGKLDGVPILIAGAQGRAVGRVDLVVDRQAHRVVESASRVTLTFADAVTPDPAMAAFVDSIAAAVRPLAERVLCEAPRALARNRRGESTLGDWVADVMRARAGADVAMQNPGGLRADIAAGPVTVQDIFELMPFDNRIAVVRLTGAQLLDAVEHSVSGGSCPGISGVRFEYDPTRPARERVVKLTLTDGRAVNPGATYLMATNDFLAQGGDGFKVFAQGRDLKVTDDLVRDALVADCEARGRRGERLDYQLDGRITAVGAGAAAGRAVPAPAGERR